NLKTITYTYVTEGFTNGLPYFVQHPDTTTTTFEYPDQFTTVRYDPDGTQTTNVVDDWGKIQSVTKIDSSTGVVLDRQTYNYKNGGYYYDELRRNYDGSDLAGRTNRYTYDCCNLTSVTGPDGETTQYTFDALKREIASAMIYGGTAGITNTNVMDGV